MNHNITGASLLAILSIVTGILLHEPKFDTVTIVSISAQSSRDKPRSEPHGPHHDPDLLGREDRKQFGFGRKNGGHDGYSGGPPPTG